MTNLARYASLRLLGRRPYLPAAAGGDGRLRIALYEGTSPRAAPVDVEWSQLVQLLSEFDAAGCDVTSCPGRDCPAKLHGAGWSPVELSEPHRANKNVIAVTALVYDLDHLKEGDLERVLDGLDGVRWACHSTHSHSPEDQCYRLVVVVDRPMTPAEYPTVRRVVRDAFAIPADDKAKDLSRYYYLPLAREGSPRVARSGEGEPIVVDEALAPQATSTTKSGDITTEVGAPPATDLEVLRKRVAEVRRSKAHGGERERQHAAWLGRVLDGEPLAPVGERDDTLLRVCGILAHWLPAGTSWEAIKELLRPSVSAMDGPEGPEHWLALGERKYRTSAERRARIEEEDRRFTEAVRGLADKGTGTTESIAAQAAALGAALGDGKNWQDLLLRTKDGLKSCEYNVHLILICDPKVKGTIWWDEGTKQIRVDGGPLAGVPASTLHTATAIWLQASWGLMVGDGVAGRCLLEVARNDPRDPLLNYLGELAWDGVDRATTFLERYFGAVGPKDYLGMVSRRWLIALVARALRPGCKMDNVLILQGPQGIGKSKALRIIATPDYFVDTALSLGDRESLNLITSRGWIVELGELASLRRAETDRVKQFVTSQVDTFRPPYGKVAEQFPRRCVFVGTTNEDQYLKDETGNRRYWPVRVTKVDCEALERDREQLLAQAVAMLADGERWWLEGEEQAIAEAEAEQHVEDDPWEQRVLAWADDPTGFSEKEHKMTALPVTTSNVLVNGVGRPAGQCSRADQMRVGGILRKAGWVLQKPHSGPRIWVKK